MSNEELLLPALLVSALFIFNCWHYKSSNYEMPITILNLVFAQKYWNHATSYPILKF